MLKSGQHTDICCNTETKEYRFHEASCPYPIEVTNSVYVTIHYMDTPIFVST